MAKEAVNLQFDGEDLRVLMQAIEETADVYQSRASDPQDAKAKSTPGHEWRADAERLRGIAVRMDVLREMHPISFGVESVGADEKNIVIDSAWLLKFVETKAAALVETVRRKNADYSGVAPDPFGNFRNVEDLGIATVEQGFLTRMTDKLARAASLTKPGKVAQVKDESVEDTLFDLAAYSFLLAAYRASVRLSREGRTLP